MKHFHVTMNMQFCVKAENAVKAEIEVLEQVATTNVLGMTTINRPPTPELVLVKTDSGQWATVFDIKNGKSFEDTFKTELDQPAEPKDNTEGMLMQQLFDMLINMPSPAKN